VACIFATGLSHVPYMAAWTGIVANESNPNRGWTGRLNGRDGSGGRSALGRGYGRRWWHWVCSWRSDDALTS